MSADLPTPPRDPRLPPPGIIEQSYLTLVEDRRRMAGEMLDWRDRALDAEHKVRTVQEAWRIITGQEEPGGEG